MVPIEHARQSVARWGGTTDDYIKIHELMDSSGETFGDLRHRTLTHNTWFVKVILEKIFGHEITLSNGVKISVREIGQYHVMEDFRGGNPSPGDYLQHLKFQSWMDNGASGPNGEPPPTQQDLPPVDLRKLYPAGEPGKQKMREPEKQHPPFFEFEGDQAGNCGGGGRYN